VEAAIDPQDHFKDHFSSAAEGYAKHRPSYPRELFEFVAGRCRSRESAWDCGTGSGQAALFLTEFFDRVVATDASAKQIAHAARHPRIEYITKPAERTGFNAQSMDLITVAQAMHWFDFDSFFDEVRRVARPGGILAAWTYGVPDIEGVPREVLLHFHRQTVGPYWPPERRYVDEDYRTIPFPFEEMDTPGFHSDVRWTLVDFVGFVDTWSSVKRYREERGEDPVPLIVAAFAGDWAGESEVRTVSFPIHMRLGRVN